MNLFLIALCVSMFIFIFVCVCLLYTKKKITVYATIAKTNKEMKKGLMFIKYKLPTNHGMLFMMPSRNNHLFWMKNTFIPLDIIFIDKTSIKNNFTIVGVHKNRQPHDKTLKGIGKKSDSVLEMNGGWFDSNDMRIGDIIDMRYKMVL